MYDSQSKLTQELHYMMGLYPCGAIKSMKRGSIIYVRANLLKPNEVNAFLGLNGQQIDNATIKVMNYKYWQNQR